MNTRITEQGPVCIQLRNVPDDWTVVDWNEMCRPALRLMLERREGSVFVTIPSVGAWNGGYLSGTKTEG